MTRTADTTSAWLFSKQQDLWAFGAPALLGFALIAALPQLQTGMETPSWLWIAGILLVDVAHVWTTLFVTYLNPIQRRTHWIRYLAVPLGSFAIGTGTYHLGGPTAFWRMLAYLAVFHFVRQQAGWLALYRLRMGEHRNTKHIDTAAIYASTLYPLLWWHVHMPRNYVWFVAGDFFPSVDATWLDIARPLYWFTMALYAAKATWEAAVDRPIPWGKHCLVATTALTWYVGIVTVNSEAAFTITNVFTHGIPYMFLIHQTRQRQLPRSHAPFADASQDNGAPVAASPKAPRRTARGTASLVQLFAVVWLLAYVEEWSWNLLVWKEHKPWFAPIGDVLHHSDSWEIQWLPIVVPLLAMPQLSHYLLDSMIWKRTHNPYLSRWLHEQRV